MANPPNKKPAAAKRGKKAAQTQAKSQAKAPSKVGAAKKAKPQPKKPSKRRADTDKPSAIDHTGNVIPQPVKTVGYWGSVCAIWGLIAGILTVFVMAGTLPDLKAPPAPGANRSVLVIRTQTGAEIDRAGPIQGDQLLFDDIPDVLIQAFLAIEDRSFFTHIGVDAQGIARAAYNNIRSGRVAGGGSTITQQLAKNMFLEFDQTFSRKAKELLIALWLEQEYSKEEILALYLNRIYFGGGAYGIDAAARLYFGHSARTLDLKEAALLAGIVKSPTRYAPHLNPEASWERAQTVLQAMEDIGLLTPKARVQLSQLPPNLKPPEADRHLGYFTDWINARVRKLTGRSGKFDVYTTLNPSQQKAAADAVSQSLANTPADKRAGEAALISLSTDGAIRAMVGGRDYAKSQFNRATDAVRQPGSAFKLFPYLAALEQGASPSDRARDEAITVDGWSPNNYSNRFYGDMSLSDAFARSINTIAVKVAEKAGRDRVASMAKRLGISTRVDALASLPLGTEEVRLIDLAGAYAAIANGGLKVKPYAILEIRDQDGALLYRKDPNPPTPVLNFEVVDDITRMLEGVIETGSGRRAQLDRPAAAKTGTTQDNRDAVFVGFTADLVTAVWTGNDDFSPMPGVTGGGLPATIWRSYNLAAHAGLPPRPLRTNSLAEMRVND